MIKKGLFFTFIVFLTLSITANATEKGYQKILGMWEFSAPTARQPYNSGKLSLKEVDKKLMGEFIIQGQTTAIHQLSFKSDTLTLNFEIENTPLVLKLKLKDGLLEGITDTPDGPVNVKVKPISGKTR